MSIPLTSAIECLAEIIVLVLIAAGLVYAYRRERDDEDTTP